MSALAKLAQYAVLDNNKTARTPTHLLSIEDARAKVVVKDGNKKAAADGSQALTLVLGRRKLSLDSVAPNATRINAPKDQVDAFTKVLLDAVSDGDFDDAIKTVQAAAKATLDSASVAVEKAPESVAEVAEETPPTEPVKYQLDPIRVEAQTDFVDGLDLSSI